VKLLVLAGTSEARALCAALAGDPRVEVVASLAGETRAPLALGVTTRIGGFGGGLEQEKFIKDNDVDAVIDATHPFAARISERTQAMCARLGLPCLRLVRPGWQPEADDRWTFVDQPAEVALHLPETATVFLATGRKSLAGFANLAGRRVLCRVIDPPRAAFPLAGGKFVVGRPPFSVEDEVQLFTSEGVEVLVVKDSGGAAGRAKLLAARLMSLPVILIRRPPPPPGDRVESVSAALDWLERVL
jgi:precorrin-6A/cobalt-precorrin-6A reductase